MNTLTACHVNLIHTVGTAHAGGSQPLKASRGCRFRAGPSPDISATPAGMTGSPWSAVWQKPLHRASRQPSATAPDQTDNTRSGARLPRRQAAPSEQWSQRSWAPLLPELLGAAAGPAAGLRSRRLMAVSIPQPGRRISRPSTRAAAKAARRRPARDSRQPSTCCVSWQEDPHAVGAPTRYVRGQAEDKAIGRPGFNPPPRTSGVCLAGAKPPRAAPDRRQCHQRGFLGGLLYLYISSNGFCTAWQVDRR